MAVQALSRIGPAASLIASRSSALATGADAQPDLSPSAEIEVKLGKSSEALTARSFSSVFSVDMKRRINNATFSGRFAHIIMSTVGSWGPSRAINDFVSCESSL